jgi:hypothetical protein
MKIFIILCLTIIILFPLVHVHASPRDAELVLENIRIEPFYPKKGDLVTINADIYNAGLKNTNLFASIITVAYFIDEKLIHVDDIGDIAPGIQNKITIASSPISKTELGNHEIKIVLDYHNTLSDQFDSTVDNVLKTSFFVDPPLSTTLSLDIFPVYAVQGGEMPKIIVSLMDSNTNLPLIDKNIILNLDGNNLNLTTNKEGQISISTTVVSLGSINVEAYFEGDGKYSPSNSSSTIYSFSKEMESSLIITILDSQNKYNFENYVFDVLIFQDSYDNLLKKIQPDSTVLLDSKTFLIPLPPDHDYFTEIYLDGRLFSVTDKILLKRNSILGHELEIPELATVKFEVVGGENLPITGMLIKNWMYSVPVENGFTDWIDILPTKYGKPYVAELFLDDQKIIQSDPFFLFSGERKTIPMVMPGPSPNFEIPSWIKNNAGWWADGQIDDRSFVGGIQFLIQEGFMKIPVTEQGSISQGREIPSWIKNNAGWWADGQIDDRSFVGGIQFLIQEGILSVP